MRTETKESSLGFPRCCCCWRHRRFEARTSPREFVAAGMLTRLLRIGDCSNSTTAETAAGWTAAAVAVVAMVKRTVDAATVGHMHSRRLALGMPFCCCEHKNYIDRRAEPDLTLTRHKERVAREISNSKSHGSSGMEPRCAGYQHTMQCIIRGGKYLRRRPPARFLPPSTPTPHCRC